MKLGVLFSGGKDSTFALLKALEHGEDSVVCLITLKSKNPESFMFHTPNISITSLQAEALGIPLIEQATKGVKEAELADLKRALERAKKVHKIEGVVTGAIESVYQASRVQKVCDELDLWCFNPLWKKDQVELVREIIAHDFDVIISGVFAYPLKKDLLGQRVTPKLLDELVALNKKYQISPSGEGGEIETTVLSAPFFKKRIEILDHAVESEGHSAIFIIKKARLVGK